MSICVTQAACAKGLSSLNSSLLLHETVAHNVSLGRSTYVTFFDTKKAFDTVWIDGLFYMLYVRGVRGKLWRLLRSAYMDCLCAVLLGGKLSSWFKLLQGVKQGAIISMLLYICFINGLMLEVMDSNLGTVVLEVESGCVGYADDLAFITNSAVNMQLLIDSAKRYSSMWRFQFGIQKCATLVFNSHQRHEFTLGAEKIGIRKEYTHVGIPCLSSGAISKSAIQARIDACRGAFYATLGCSLVNTTLSPSALSKIYWACAIPKLLYGCEVRSYSDTEIVEYEKFHRSMARNIQCLPSNVPNPAVTASMGWRSVLSYIHICRLNFILRILSLDPKSIYRVLYIRRFYYVLYSSPQTMAGPVAESVRLCVTYQLLDNVLQMFESGVSLSKGMWKRLVLKAVDDRDHATWRFELSLYPRLRIYRVVVSVRSNICWWRLAKNLPFLKKPCATMVRLVCGSSVLAEFKQVQLPRDQRLCKQCLSNVVEDLYHFVMHCSCFSYSRTSMFDSIRSSLSMSGCILWDSLGIIMQANVIMGLDFPFSHDDIFLIRKIACISVHKMYFQRSSLEA